MERPLRRHASRDFDPAQASDVFPHPFVPRSSLINRKNGYNGNASFWYTHLDSFKTIVDSDQAWFGVPD